MLWIKEIKLIISGMILRPLIFRSVYELYNRSIVQPLHSRHNLLSKRYVSHNYMWSTFSAMRWWQRPLMMLTNEIFFLFALEKAEKRCNIVCWKKTITDNYTYFFCKLCFNYLIQCIYIFLFYFYFRILNLVG